MHPFLFEIGSFRVPTYGLFAVGALVASVLLIRRYARLEGRNPTQVTDAIVLSAAVGFAGARVFEIVINWERYFGTPGGWKLLPFSTGVYLGAVITAIPFGIWWFRRIRLPYLQGLDILALVAAVAEGVGRWGCFASGCCWGTPTNLPWAVTFPEIARRLHRGLPDVPIHPTQVYMALTSLVILGILLLLYWRKRFHGQIIAAWLALYTGARFFLEVVRGDEERGFVLGGALSTSQFLSLLLFAIAILVYVALDRRHRRSGAPDWSPAPAAARPRSKR